MAEAVCPDVGKAVTSVLEKIGAVLLETGREVQAVREQIERVQKELRLIEALLRDVDSKCHRNNVVTEWLKQVKEIADQIATIINTFRDKIEENRAESSNWVSRKCTMAKTNYKTYKLGLHDELKKIIGKLERLYQLRTDFRIDDLGALHDDVDVGTGGLGKTTLAQKVYNSDKLEGHHPEPCDDVDDPEPCDDVPDPEVVSLEDDQAKIIEQLLDRSIST